MKTFWTVLLCYAWLCAGLFTPALVRAQVAPPADAVPFEVLATQGGQLTATALSAPVLPSAYRTSAELGEVTGLRLAGQRLYASNARAVQILDVSQPLTPTLQSQILVDRLNRLLAVGDWLYLLDGTTLRIIDLTQPTSPIERTTITAVHDVQVEGGLAYLFSDGALRIYSVAKPANPELLGQVAVPAVLSGNTIGVWVAGDRAYVGHFGNASCELICGARQMQLSVVSIADPSHPQLRGERSVWTSASHNDPLAIVGTTIYLPVAPTLIDASDPDHPVERSAPALLNALALRVKGTHAYAVTSQVLRTLDLTDPLNPRVLGELPLASVQPSLALSAGRLFLAGEGLRVFDLSDPASPQLRATYAGPVVDLVVDRQYVYMALGSGGIRILRLDPAVFPLPVYLPQVRRA
ncbi:MAG: hypothetical protein OHK0022_03910 [Roseiflexaceae bacterium]